ncbi:Hypothetical predicted protein [Mytilus galloprovincialis]|uniref:Paraneoplastic antigen Ma-like C-terminal domain-containing protein n=1 Tax=Mytilus galloprovincialis TaxID=29158 RepID=A0A8B6H2Q2_MYTGA|nr:Hypothetical predicted protein [Mytilus galloprovincialis]
MNVEPKANTPEEFAAWMQSYLQQQGKQADVKPNITEPQPKTSTPYVHPPRVNTFQGNDKTVKGENTRYDLWRHDIRCLLNEKTHSVEAITQAVSRSVKGEAGVVLMHLGEHASIFDILQKFDCIFGNIDEKETIMSEFYNAKQKEEEDVSTWSCRLEDILSQALNNDEFIVVLRKIEREHIVDNPSLKPTLKTILEKIEKGAPTYTGAPDDSDAQGYLGAQGYSDTSGYTGAPRFNNPSGYSGARGSQPYRGGYRGNNRGYRGYNRGFQPRARGAAIEKGDKVLVRKVAFDGKHKIADKWENEPYIILSQPNLKIPVFNVKKENGEGRLRTLHRNLLLPIGHISDKTVKTPPKPKPRLKPMKSPPKPKSDIITDTSDLASESSSEDECYFVPVMTTDSAPTSTEDTVALQEVEIEQDTTESVGDAQSDIQEIRDDSELGSRFWKLINLVMSY